MEKNHQINVQATIDKIRDLSLIFNHVIKDLERIDNELIQLSNYFDAIEQSFLVTEEHVNSNHVFDTFVEGDCNKLARLCAISVAEKPGESMFNPFIVYGSNGLGKTHLLQSIFNDLRHNKPEYKAIYFRCETFCLQFVHSIRNNRTPDFLKYLYEQDTLIIDDLHYLEAKGQTQQLLIEIMDHYLNNGKQVIFSTKILPKDIMGLDNALLSRISNGLLVNLNVPKSQTIFDILKKKARQCAIDIPEIILNELAAKEYADIRELEGNLVSLIANATILNEGWTYNKQ
jgi:chromosomal replication initiator protein